MRATKFRNAAIGAVMLATLTAGALTNAIGSASASTPTNSSIVAAAVAYSDGSRVGDGQCWTFMHEVVLTASGGTMKVGQNNDYYGSYTAVGGQPVGRDDAQPGDIIQKYNPANPTDAAHVHTAIILGHTVGSNAFSIIAQNATGSDLVVSRNTSYNPWANLSAGWAVAIWRLGIVSTGGGGGGIRTYVGNIVRWAPDGTSWLVRADGVRYWIPTGGDFQCLQSLGAAVYNFDGTTWPTLSAIPIGSGRGVCPKPLSTGYTIQIAHGLSRGESIRSANGLYLLYMQPDGNLVLYGPTGALWATFAYSAGYVVLQGDGNFVEYDTAGRAPWNTRTSATAGLVTTGNYLALQTDGNVVLYNGQNRALWATMTQDNTNRLGTPAGFKL